MSVSTIMQHAFLDASALVKLILYPDLEEEGSIAIHTYCREWGNVPYTNEACIAETLGVLKAKNLRKEISFDGYLKSISLLQRYIDNKTIKKSRFQMWDQYSWDKAVALAKKYNIDVLDTMQIVDVLEGQYKGFAGVSKTLLITADRRLRDAARSEGVKVWYPIDEKFEDAY